MEVTVMGIVIILYLLVCFYVMYFANRKGKSGIAFFLLSFFSSPMLGFLVLLLISTPGKLKKCERCAELVREDAKRCRYCGNENIFFDR
jgi:hypothetical protein